MTNTTVVEKVSGKLARIIFQKNAFAIIVLACGNRNVTVAGTIPQCEIGATYNVSGNWETSKYGQQLKAIDVQISMPEDRSGIVAFLKQIEGIGDIKARKIVDKLGADCLKLIAEKPAILTGISGIREALANKVAETISAKANKADLDATLLQLMSSKVLESAKEDFGIDWLKAALAENPYRLIAIPRISFSKVDSWVLATKRLAADSCERAGAIVAEVVRKACEWGHTWIDFDMAVANARNLRLAVPITGEAQILNGVKKAIQDKMLVEVHLNGTKGIALESLARAEETAARTISEWLANNYELGAVELA